MRDGATVGIIGHQIIDIRHILGKTNVVADGLSRQRDGVPRTGTDGSEWTVCEDWEANADIINNVFQVNNEHPIENLADTLLQRFKDEPVFTEVVQALLDLGNNTTEREKSRARHWSEQYLIENGRLWRLQGGTATRARSCVECVSKVEATELARAAHQDGGHWGRDAIKIQLMDRICSPIDASILTAIQECPKCKNFGSTHLHALLNPITQRHPLELLMGNYLKLPDGKGGYHEIGVFLDTFSQHVWAFMLKKDSSAKSTIDVLKQIFHSFAPPETLLSDGGKKVRDFCATWGTDTHIVAV